MNVISRGIRNAFRNVMRTVSIVIILGLSIGLSLVMLIAHQAVDNKIDSVKGSIGNSITVRPAGSMSFGSSSEASNGLSRAQVNKLRSIPHITGVTEALTGHLTTTGSNMSIPRGAENMSNGGGVNGETSLKSPVKINADGQGGGLVIRGGPQGGIPKDFAPPIRIIGTNTPLKPSEASIEITKGVAINGNADTDTALISESMASKNNLQVGSTFTAYGKTLTVAGIFKSSTEAESNAIVVSLVALERLTNNANAVSDVTASVDSVANIDSATEAVKKSLGSTADVTNSKEQVQNAIEPLQSIQNVSLYSLIGSVAAGGVIILLTMIMIVRERKREIGIFKAIGFSNIRIMTQFTFEALTLTMLGAVIGLSLGVIAANPVTQMLVSSSTEDNGPRGFGKFISRNTVDALANIQTEIGWTIILYGLGAAILIAIIGSALASYFISKVRPAEVLRSE